jgi:hypothetical protein
MPLSITTNTFIGKLTLLKGETTSEERILCPQSANFDELRSDIAEPNSCAQRINVALER